MKIKAVVLLVATTMQGLEKPLRALFAALLVAAPIHGYAQLFDCRSCHGPIGAPGARDLSRYYDSTVRHHKTEMEYPADSRDFALPSGESFGTTFFDRNRNGRPDNDEIQMFDTSGAIIIECATCHMEHGDAPPPANTPPHPYLRIKNTGSSLCLVCHIM